MVTTRKRTYSNWYLAKSKDHSIVHCSKLTHRDFSSYCPIPSELEDLVLQVNRAYDADLSRCAGEALDELLGPVQQENMKIDPKKFKLRMFLKYAGHLLHETSPFDPVDDHVLSSFEVFVMNRWDATMDMIETSNHIASLLQDFENGEDEENLSVDTGS